MEENTLQPSLLESRISCALKRTGRRDIPLVCQCARSALCLANVTSFSVKSALKQPRTHIVSYDWLEDTLLDRKKKSVGRYRWAFLEQEREEQANEKKAVVRNYVDSKQPAKAFQAGCECAQQDLHSDNYHIYRDDSSFPYNIVLTRADAVGTNVDKVTLRVRLAHGSPQAYMLIFMCSYTNPTLIGPHSTQWSLLTTSTSRQEKRRSRVSWCPSAVPTTRRLAHTARHSSNSPAWSGTSACTTTPYRSTWRPRGLFGTKAGASRS